MPRLLAILLVLFASHQFAFCQSLPDTSKMNILFINIEDCNASVFGYAGHPIVKTPHIDKLASTGVAFHAAYVQGMACNPSRSSFLTGLRPLSTGVTRNEQNMSRHLPPGTLTLPEMLKAHGFYTADIGKLFHTLEYAPKQMASFDRIEMYDKPDGWQGPGPVLTFPPVKRKNLDPAPKDKESREYREWKRRNSGQYGDSGLQPEEESDYRKAKVACALLKEFAGTRKQFFLAVAQSRPHTPLVAPRKYLDMYDPAGIPMPPATDVSKFVKFPYMARATGGNPDIHQDKQPSPEEVRKTIAAYYASVTFVDANIGMILDTLEQTGLAKDTIVIFLGDHGFHLGDHNFWSKYSMLEATRRAPLIVRVPGAPGNGKPCRQFVEFVDFVPTLAELARMNAPANLEGLSFAPLLVNPEQPWKKAIFMVENGRGGLGQVVRTRRYSYMEFQKGEVLAALYDLENDPWETINLIDDPAHAAARSELSQMLKTGWKAGLPPGK